MNQPIITDTLISELIDSSNINKKMLKKAPKYAYYHQTRRDSTTFREGNLMIFPTGDDYPWYRADNAYTHNDSVAALKYLYDWTHTMPTRLAHVFSSEHCAQEFSAKNLAHLAYGYDSVATLKCLTLFYLKAAAGELVAWGHPIEDIRCLSEFHPDLETAMEVIPYAYYICKNEIPIDKFLRCDGVGAGYIADRVLERYPQFKQYKPIADMLKIIKRRQKKLAAGSSKALENEVE